MSKKRRPYVSKKQRVTSLLTLGQQSSSDTLLKNVFQSCSKLTIDRLQDLLFDNDLNALIIDKTLPAPNEEIIKPVWNKLYVEFCQVSQGKSYNELFEIEKEMNDCRAKLRIVDEAVFYLFHFGYSADLVGILNNMGLQCDLKAEHNGNTKIKKLNAVIGRSKKWSITLKQRQFDFDRLKKQDTAKISREYFDDQLMEMSKDCGFYIKSNEITVTQFYRTLDKMLERQQQSEMKNKHHGN